MSGYLGDLSLKQEKALAQLKHNIGNEWQPHFDDPYLLRWLRARNFDVKKAENMLRKIALFTNLCQASTDIKLKEMNADDILEKWEPPEVLREYWPGGLHGYTKEGLPIWIEPTGKLDPKGMLHSCKKSDIVKFKVYHNERIQREIALQSKRLGRRIEQIVVICDFEQYGKKHFWRPAMDVFNAIVAMFEANYPETLNKTYIVNASPLFHVLISIARPFLSDETKNKVLLLGKNWKQHLLEVIDPDQLPVHWGGTATDPDGDPFCRSKIPMGGPVPNNFRILKEDLADMVDSQLVSVGRSSKVELKYDAEVSGSILQYQFFSEPKDIGFAIYYKRSESNLETVLSPHRVNSHMVTEDGLVILQQKGTYIVVFDNTFSWMTSKKIVYYIELLPPTTDLKRSSSYTDLIHINEEDSVTAL